MCTPCKSDDLTHVCPQMTTCMSNLCVSSEIQLNVCLKVMQSSEAIQYLEKGLPCLLNVCDKCLVGEQCKTHKCENHRCLTDDMEADECMTDVSSMT